MTASRENPKRKRQIISPADFYSSEEEFPRFGGHPIMLPTTPSEGVFGYHLLSENATTAF